MRLAAIFIKNHFLFDEPQIINLGGKYIYDFKIIGEDNLTLEKTLNKDYINGFFGEKIELLSAIVGENGSGKSSLLFEIQSESCNLINYHYAINKINTLFIYEKDNLNLIFTKIYYYNTTRDEFFKFQRPLEATKDFIFFKGEFDIKEKLIDVDLSKFKQTNNSEIYFYYYNPLQLNNKSNNSINISALADLMDEIIFFSNDKLIKSLNEIYFDINFYKTINIEVNQSGNNLKSIESHINSSYKKKFKSEAELFSYIDDESLKDGNYFLFNHLYKIYLKQNENSITFDSNGKIFIIGLSENYKLFEIFYQLIARLFFYNLRDINFYDSLCVEFIEKISIKCFENKENYLGLVESIIEFIKKYKENFTENDLAFYNSILNFIKYLPIDLKLVLRNDNLETSKIFLESYINIFNISRLVNRASDDIENQEYINTYFLKFTPDFRISQGEKFLIKLFSKLYANKFYQSRMSVDNYLLLDEPDIGFHPEWKKKYINAILKCLPLILDIKDDKKLQIIFTTHDPLTLSDIPNNNVVYLKKDKKSGKTKILKDSERPQKSFGANITDLLADSFFIEDGLIGDFAKGKINEVIDFLNEEEPKIERKAEVKNIIEIIDEPLMKNKLLEMYFNRFPEEYDIEKEKEQIRKRAIELGLIPE